MTKTITLKEFEYKYGRRYLILLKTNKWIQAFNRKKNKYNETCQGLWIPSFPYLWNLIETYIPVDPETTSDVQEYINNVIRLTKSENKYIAKLIPKKNMQIKKEVTTGETPEEALLRLLIKLEKK